MGMETLGRKIGQVKHLQKVQDGIYFAKWSAYTLEIWINDMIQQFATHEGIKNMNAMCLAKCKEGIITIHEF